MARDHRTTVSNVLVIGAGGAGLRAAIAAHDAGREVTIVGKRLRTDAHTVLAAGGINAALGTVDPDDRPRWHFLDTWNEGYFLADPRKIELLVEEAPHRIRELDAWGMPFARTPDGDLDQRYFGAHRYRRTCYAGDWTGRAMVETLHQQVTERGIPIVERTYVSRLLVHDGTCFGALAFDLASGERTVHLADAVVLAGGGHTRLWRRSSSRRDENNGDAMYLALAAGCELQDLELVQFHPTGMTHPEEWAGQLVTEAVRGEGGHLKNAEGERFMSRYDPDRMELSTRDRVALANYTEIAEGRGGPNGGVFLDISHLDRETIRQKLPRMHRQLIEAQMLDIAEHPIEVAPTAHYSMGGVHVTPETGATGVEGLFAAGEITAGLHGANRLGGNSLTETAVFGARAGAAAAAHSDELSVQLRSKAAVTAALDELDACIHDGNEVVRVGQRELRDIMWEHVGVVRDERGLDRGVARIRALQELIPELDVQPDSQGFQDLAGVLDLRGSIVSALATALSARERRETRGAQQRKDHPERDDERQLCNHVVRLDDDGEVRLTSRPRVAVPAHLRDWAEEAEAVDTAGRLLE
ncbi:FAD-dependent oxidoreductase [Egicoccus sp. AB-alg2]|uniref:FAD-dependent oxidoreductase n=1 Tax=Egicoccus sp. AB-alg2 TaxID=3242693 RepID=UPI00359CBD08